jgi:hypothetical protein
LHPFGGSTPRMWPLFLLRAKGKGKEMTGTLHVGTYKTSISSIHYNKKCVCSFSLPKYNFEMNYSSAIATHASVKKVVTCRR